MTQSKLLIIAGSDPCGGAGIQADIKTATKYKVYSAAAITCLTAQNTKGVSAIHNPPVKFLCQQLKTLFDDIEFDVVKIGMLGTAEIIDCVADILNNKIKKIPIILDTVMVATSGDLLLEKNAVESLKKRLVPYAYIVTPNIDEAQVLAKMKISNVDDMKLAAIKIKALGAKNVLIKGGHLELFGKNSQQKIFNVLLDSDKEFHIITNKKIGKKNIHGTGCTLASAIACNIANGCDVVSAVRKANQYVYRAITASLEVGKGSLVLKHF